MHLHLVSTWHFRGRQGKLTMGMEWNPDFNLFTLEGCSATYEGKTIQGSNKGGMSPCTWSGPGYSCSYCSVDFPCEGGR